MRWEVESALIDFDQQQLYSFFACRFRSRTPGPPRRRDLNKLSGLEPAEPARRYERENFGELIQIDIKKLGRIGSVGHHVTGRQPGLVNRHHGVGVRSCLHRRCLAGRFCSGPARPAMK
jgi:hypothetical protein